MMDSPKKLFCYFFLVLFLSVIGAEGRVHRHGPTKLFVFGDSYVDTGNTRKDGPGSWKEPYGITFPGKPAGRFSDGRVFADFLAKYLGLKSPVPYNLREKIPNNLKYGMNFAFGGTGVFNATLPPSLATQIDFFKKLIKDKVYTASDLSHSVAYVSVAGNDYNHYLKVNGSAQGFPSFIASVVNQTTIDLIQIHKLGVKKIVVGGLQPLECLPLITAQSSFQHCNSTFITLVGLHNDLLKQAVAKLNQQIKSPSPAFIILDLYDSFKSVLDHPVKTNKFKSPLIPCCVGVSKEYTCGGVDENGVKKYTVCKDPELAFFWDLFHPTQAGWRAVFNELKTMNGLSQI